MLEPRENDIPALFLVFVVLPLVCYFLLEKWSEISKREERVSLIAKRAAEEALPVDDMAVGSFIPGVQLSNHGTRQCAKCFGPAATRCSQCKSVWYCCARCQIIHWRQVHKLECQKLGNNSKRSSLKPLSSEGSCGRDLYAETMEQSLFDYNLSQSNVDKSLSDDVVPPHLREADFVAPEHQAKVSYASRNRDGDLKDALNESGMAEMEIQNAFDGGHNFGILNSPTTAISGTNASDTRMDVMKEHLSNKGIPCNKETKAFNSSSGRTSKSNRERNFSRSSEIELHRTPKSGVEVFKEPLYSEGTANKQRKVKMIYPYEEFVKCFQFKVFDMQPRGLVNCGNSCYANAVLQCLMCTKPLMIYLLRQSHSRAGCNKDWCLMCELEQLVLMLRESGGPLSPMNILMYVRSLNSQIGDGSQEDAHEFLRLLVASMQSICLEGFGGENVVDPRLQDTTFIQHVFGGRLRSKVKCLRCCHESVRYESMMDLTLEIFGWVESLEDALTQFTSPEDLDGDNMYRCARCASYVRARKQLSIQEAPNILTIVLKRFQEGNYGKINKCITFPEMLDMIPFVTGTDDIPPLYLLYAVVVHLDTSNASFSGHYISYVKDLHDNWLRVDDTEVQQVELSQVMSEGAYILFYMRSHPRPARVGDGKTSRNRTPCLSKHCTSKTQNSRPEQDKSKKELVNKDPSSYHKLETNVDYSNISRGILVRENRSRPSVLENYAEFSDTTSSDRPLFTSSDDSSFTTESTRDSFSTDDPFSSIFQYPEDRTSRRTISCCMYLNSVPPAVTRFAHERRVSPQLHVHDDLNSGVHVNTEKKAW